MNPHAQDLTTGPLGRQIFRFSFPLILTNLLQVLFNMADIAVVGRFAGSAALGSVGSTMILVSLFTGLLIGMASGVNVHAALHFGAKQWKTLSDTVHTAFIVCTLFGLFLMAFGILLTRPVLTLMHTKNELIDGAVLYLKLCLLGVPALAIFNFGNAVFSAVGDTVRPLRYLFVSGIVNVLLNLLFVICLHMDVAGVALASAISQYLSAILVISALFRTNAPYGLQFSALRLHPRHAKALLALGIPSALQLAIFALANLFIQTAVNSFDAIMVEGNSAAVNEDALVYETMAAFHTACSSFIGQNLGAGQKERIRKSYLISLAYSFCFGMGLGLLILTFGRPFLSLFTRDAIVVEAGMKRLTIMSLSYGFSAFMDCTISASRGLGKSVAPMVIVMLGSCVFRILWIHTIFAYFHTMTSLYLLYIFSFTLTSLFEILYFIRTYRQETSRLA